MAIKAALKDQELAGVDIVSDGELRRDNDIDYLLTRIPGVEIPDRAKTDYYDYYDAQVRAPLAEAAVMSPGLAADFAFTREQTQHPIKFSFTGPREYLTGFHGPGKYDGSVVNWVNGPLLVLAGNRRGFDVQIAPARRPGANVKTLTAQVRD